MDPGRFLGDLGELWHSRNGFGGIADQYIGYLVPMLPYYGLAELTKVPTWLAERLWLSLIVATAFWGALRLAERLRVGSSATRLLGALVYALWPTYTIVIGSTSAAALPGAMLPWVLLPLTDARLAPRIAAARSALLIPLMGGVNAASTLASLLPVGLYLLSRPGGPRKRALLLWWIPGVILATAWWIVPLLLLGVFGENFMPYVESSFTTTTTMSAAEALRGAGNWVGYLNFGEAWLPAGWTVVTGTVTILGSALAAALGLAGLARRDLPERRWLVLTVLSVALITLAGYGGALGGLFHGTVQEWLDTWLVPFRNIYKFQTGLALALALGLAHITAVLALRLGQDGQDGRVPVRARRLARWSPPCSCCRVLPGRTSTGRSCSRVRSRRSRTTGRRPRTGSRRTLRTTGPSWCPPPRTASTPGAPPSTSRWTCWPTRRTPSATTSPSAPRATGGRWTRSSRRSPPAGRCPG